jgi:hypothetical protein
MDEAPKRSNPDTPSNRQKMATFFFLDGVRIVAGRCLGHDIGISTAGGNRFRKVGPNSLKAVSCLTEWAQFGGKSGSLLLLKLKLTLI